MACSYPQWRIPWSKALVAHPLARSYESRVHNDGVIIQRPEFNSIKAVYPILASKIDQIPCGKCIQCRLAYSREWANRCMCELKTSDNALFLTLTYDDGHLEFGPYVDPETGAITTRAKLVPKHFTNFMKRLRAWSGELHPGYHQRFFACGEYGDESSRPHYHAIIYNLPPEFTEKSHLFTAPGVQPPLWTSPALSKLWPYGMSVYGDVTWDTCAYVARYVTKKRKGKDRKAQIEAQEIFFPGIPWQDEFTRMSRMPGLGREYYEKCKSSIYATDEMFVPIKGNVQPVRPAKYYDKLYDIECPERIAELKAQRKKAAEQIEMDVLSRTDLNAQEYIDLKRRSKEAQAQMLVRPSI